VRDPAILSSRALRAAIISGMTQDLEARLRGLRASVATDALVDLGCDLAEVDRHQDAEWCFRRAADLGDPLGSFNLAIALRAQHRDVEAVAAYEAAIDGGVTDAWRNLGGLLEELGDLAGAMHAYRGAVRSGDLTGGLQLAFLLREQGERLAAMEVAEQMAAGGHVEAAAVHACWRWCATLDVTLEADLRAAADHYPPARADLADLLRETGRQAEARSVLERGAKLGEAVAWLPLGNFYADEMGDEEAAEEAYRGGIAAGEVHCHHNLAYLLAERGDLEGAVEQFRLGAAAGDPLAADALRELEHG
jgi:tetratricopeptide (TPR) repeat protein